MAQNTSTEQTITTTNVPVGLDNVATMPVNMGEMEFTISRDTTNVTYFPDTGATKLVTLASLDGTEEVTVSPTVASANNAVLDIIFKEYNQLSATCPRQIVRNGTVSQSDQIDTLTNELTGKAVNEVRVSIADNDGIETKPFRVVAVAAANADEVQLDAGTGILTFFADSHRGTVMKITINDTITNVRSWFKEAGPQVTGSVSMQTALTFVHGTFLTLFPQLAVQGDTSFTLGAEFDLGLELLAETPAGERNAFQMFAVTNLKTAGTFN